MWGKFGQKSLEFIQRPIAEHARINILEGSVRSGKTWTMIPTFLHYLKDGPPGLLAIVGKSKTTVYDNVLRDLFSTVGSRNYRYNRQYGDLRLYGRDVKVIAAKDQGSEDYIRGLTLAGVYGDEASLYPENVFKQLLNRCSVENSKLFFTTNPDSPYHFLHVDYIADQAKRDSGMVHVVHFGLDDNPNLSEEYKTFISTAYSGLWYKRMVLGLWVAAEGAIYDMFDNLRHTVSIKDVPEEFDRQVVGIDYGSGNPTVFKRWGFTHTAKNKPDAWSLDEYYHDGAAHGAKTTGQYKQALIKFCGNLDLDIYCPPDPGALAFALELKSNSFGRRFNVKRVNNDVLPGINTVSTFMSDNRFHIVREECPNTLMELVSYVWDPNAQKRGEDEPLKQHDHCMDADRYPLHTIYPATAWPRGYAAA
jgi:PBSX family phage terminase large subunit